MNEKIRWVKLSRAEIAESMGKFEIKINRNIVKNLLKKHDFVKRKMQRKRAIGKSAVREEQFQNIIAQKEKAMLSSNPVLSFDTKKKEPVGGNLHRSGSVYCTQAIEVSDHDYPYLADLKIAPHGIFDMKKNKAYVSVGTSSETAEFICDSIKNWWFEMGQMDYPNATEIIGFCDAGGANSYRHHIFKIELQKIVDAIGLPIRIIHYPPYTSKWNPIEHRVFPHITRALEGVPLQTVEEAKARIESTKTKTGLRVVAKIINKTYETGKKVTKDLINSITIKVGDSLPNLNYAIYPSGEK